LTTSPRRVALFVAVLAGLAVRVVTLTMPGTEDVMVWKTWSYGAANDLTSMYGVGGSPPVRGVVKWHTRSTTVDYPPGALYILALIGRGYRAGAPAFDDSSALTASIKLVTLGFDAITAVLVWGLARRFTTGTAAAAAALGYWINPATLIDGSVLGYLDPWMAAPALAALLAADAGLSFVAGAAVAAAVLIKAQAIFVGPVAALLLWHAAERPWRSALAGLLAFGGVTAAALWPFASRSALPNVIQGVASLMHHDMLSATAANLWWLVTWVLRAAYAVKDLGQWAAWTMTVKILAISRVVALGYPNPRPIALALVLLASAWALFRAHAAVSRGATSAVIVAAGAFIVHAYFTLGVQVHENHLFLAVPLLAVCAAALPHYRLPLAAVSAIAALNLLLFYGIGRGYPLPPRHWTVIDSTVVLAAFNVLALFWHAAALADNCDRRAADRIRD
jgi:Gpi18-like mannosyltransferase